MIFYAGDNDIANGRTPQQILDDYKAFVAKVHAALPATRIAFIGIKPSIQRWALVDKVRAANALVRDYAGTDERLGFIDVDGPMLGWDEKPRKELFIADGLHMTPKGYDSGRHWCGRSWSKGAGTRYRAPGTITAECGLCLLQPLIEVLQPGVQRARGLDAADREHFLLEVAIGLEHVAELVGARKSKTAICVGIHRWYSMRHPAPSTTCRSSPSMVRFSPVIPTVLPM